MRRYNQHQQYRCYAMEKGEVYYVHCIDLSISVERPTRKEALEEMRKMIQSYVDTCRESGFTRHIRRRKSGPIHFLRYYLRYYRERFFL